MFGIKLKEARANAKLSQIELGKELGVGNTTISNWEKGIAKPDIDTIEDICSVLSVSPNYFFKKRDPFAITLEQKDFIKRYKELDSHGKEMVDMVLDKEYERSTKDNVVGFPQMVAESPVEYNAGLNAAHERTDIEVTDEMIQHDDDIMDGDDF